MSPEPRPAPKSDRSRRAKPPWQLEYVVEAYKVLERWLRPQFRRLSGPVAVLVIMATLLWGTVVARVVAPGLLEAAAGQPPTASQATASTTNALAGATPGPATPPVTPSTPVPPPRPAGRIVSLEPNQTVDISGSFSIEVTGLHGCGTVWPEIGTWYSVEDTDKYYYQAPRRLCPGDPQYERKINFGSGDPTDCGRTYDVGLVFMPDGLPPLQPDSKRVQPRPAGAVPLTDQILKITLDGPQCRAQPSKAVQLPLVTHPVVANAPETVNK